MLVKYVMSLLALSILLAGQGSAQWVEHSRLINLNQRPDIAISISFITKDTLVLTETHNEILTSYDGGKTWNSRIIGSSLLSQLCRAVYYDPRQKRIWVGCENDQLWISDDFGRSWTDVWPFSLTSVFNSLYSFDKDLVFFSDLHSGFGFYSVSDENISWVNDRIIRPDGGTMGFFNAYQVDFVNDSVGYLVHDKKHSNAPPNIYRTEDGGYTWRFVTGNDPAGVNDKNIYIIQFITEEIGYGVSKGWSNLYKTVDGGKTWNEVLDAHGQIARSRFLTPNNLKCFDFVNEEFGMVVTDNNIYRTCDGAQTWEIVNPEIKHYIAIFDGIDCYDESNCVVFGYGKHNSTDIGYNAIWRTENGGGPGIPLSVESAPAVPQLAARIQPVPTGGDSQLLLSAMAHKEVEVRVMDIAGKLVYDTTLQGVHQHTLPSAAWASGMYLVHVIPAGQPAQVLKMVRQ